MICIEEFEILKLLRESKYSDLSSYPLTIVGSLEGHGYIKLENAEYRITTKGKRVYEEYLYSHEAIKRSTNANIVSWLALGVSALSIIANVLIAVFA